MFEARVDQLTYEFNCRPLDYVDASWLAAAPGAAIERLRRSHDMQARGAANQWLAQHLGLSAAFDFDFTHPAKRLLLLPPKALGELVLWTGVWSLSHVLRGWVCREKRAALREALGDEGVQFYLQQVLRWPGSVRLPLQNRNLVSMSPKDLRFTLHRMGAVLLLAGASLRDQGAWRRGALKLPRPVAQLRRPFRLSDDGAQRVAEFAVGCVVRQKEPAWHWLF
jgi:YOP proteins translocation protein K (YscK)/Bacterial type III secretion protein (HrpB4)